MTMLPSGMVEPIVASAPPLDFSFKELKTCSEMETEEPRNGGKRRPPQTQDAGAAGSQGEGGDVADSGGAASPQVPGMGATSDSGPKAATPQGTTQYISSGLLNNSGKTAASTQLRPTGGPSNKRVIRKKTIAVNLSNNFIESLTDLPVALDFVMDNPLQNLQWIDVSFNQLRRIDPTLLQFQQLKALYLHSNQIKSLPSVEMLRKLPQLISLTANGNPIESSPVYRVYVVGALENLRTLDHSTITMDEKRGGKSWWEAHEKRGHRKEQERQEYLDSLNE